MPADAFTNADAERMSELFQRRDDGDLSNAEHAELARLVDAWQNAVYLDLLALAPPDWQPPELTEAMVRQVLRDAGHPGDDDQVAMIMRSVARGDGTG
jgi:hypothetical protein